MEEKMKRVKPFWQDHWTENLSMFMRDYDFWDIGITEHLEKVIKGIKPREHALVVNSTSNAIWMCLYLRHLKYPNKREVLFPNWGYPAVWKACKVLGLHPVPVEMDQDSLTMEQSDLSAKINDNVLAVAHIESNGVVGDPESVKEVLPDDVLFIEDSAPSMLQDNAGMYGDVSMFSFSPTKPFCVGQGSVILTDDDELYKELKLLRHTPDYNNHDATLNFMLSPYLMALLLPQFAYFDDLYAMRTSIHNWYKEHLDIFTEPYIETNAHGSIMYMSDKAYEISNALKKYDIEHRWLGYPCYEYDPHTLMESCRIRERLIDLPMHDDLSPNEIKAICAIIRRAEDA
jgi:dTDP-4-amino-4,6-dideoxygalactose transaminase